MFCFLSHIFTTSFQSCFRSRGTRVILRADLNDEYVAGQIYAYLIRILYGEKGVKVLLQSSTSNIDQ